MNQMVLVHDAHPDRCPARTDDAKLICNRLAGHAETDDDEMHYGSKGGDCWWPEEETSGPHRFRRRDRCPARPDPEGEPHEFWASDPLRQLDACMHCGETGRNDGF